MTAVIAEVRFSHPRMHLYHTLSSLEDVVLRPDLPLHTESDRPTVFMTVEIEPDVDWETVERVLSEDETVRDASVMTDSGAMRIYRIDFDQSSIEDFPTKATDMGIHLLELWNDGTAWAARLRAVDRAYLSEFGSYCEEVGAELSVNRLYLPGSTEVMNTALSTSILTDAQWEAMFEAFEAGYFDEPRAASLSEVGERLGISASAASRRIRRGTATVIEHLAATDARGRSER
jgi:predicted DNA binding protein